MLDDRPFLKDRLTACAVFSGIAIGAVAGFELIISGGFDFITPGWEVRQTAPSAYVTVVDAPWSPDGRVIPLSSNEPLFAGAEPVSYESLEGGFGDDDAPIGGYPPVDEEVVNAEIDALYEASVADAGYEVDPFYDEAAPQPHAASGGGKADLDATPVY